VRYTFQYSSKSSFFIVAISFSHASTFCWLAASFVNKNWILGANSLGCFGSVPSIANSVSYLEVVSEFQPEHDINGGL